MQQRRCTAEDSRSPNMSLRPLPLAALLLVVAASFREGLSGPAAAADDGHAGSNPLPGLINENKTNEREKRSSLFGSRSSFFAKGRMSTGGSAIQGTKTQISAFQGGCPNRPANPLHTTIQCHTFSGCRLTCLRDYIFPNGEIRLIVTCESGEWKIAGTDWKTIPDCQPICRPPCQNNGICVKPNSCNCTEGYMGPQCQFNRRPCFNDSPLPANSQKICTSKTCTITCNNGHKFPDGSSITNLVCRDGSWVPSRKEWFSVPDCQPTCQPECENGGKCLSYNVCQCPQDYKGPQCQYEKEACDPQKLSFNGQYSCKGDMNSLTCTLQCVGGRFEREPAQAYKCQYSTGLFVPSPIPKCIYDTMIEMLPKMPSSGSHFITVESKTDSSSSLLSSLNLTSLFNKIPLDTRTIFHATSIKEIKGGTCSIWGHHYKTFDGRLLSFQSDCSYTLVQEAVDNTFSVNLGPMRNGSREIQVFAQDKEYNLLRNDKGLPIIKVGSRRFNIPTQLPGVTVKYAAHFVEMSVNLAGFSLIWDTENSVSVDINEHLWNRTLGLCGRMDSYPENDFQTKEGEMATRIIPFVNSWQAARLGETCSSIPDETNPCDSPLAKDGTANKASLFCDKLLSDPHFAVCRSVIDVQQYYEVCRWDYCTCHTKSSFSNSSQECACRSIAMYAEQCHSQNIPVHGWRDVTMCSMNCGGGRVYMSCNPDNQPLCGSEEELENSSVKSNLERKDGKCIEGCYCPRGTVLHQNQCIKRDQCPCQLRGRSFPPGHSIPKDCNTCTCDKGRWSCTQTRCSARCSSIGDPHYTTFDGKRYDFMGKCSYYLLKGNNYSIEAENVHCSGAISKNMGFLNQHTSGTPSCTKSVTVRYGNKKIDLKQGREVLVNGVEVASLPTDVSGVLIHPVSSIYNLVELPNKLTVWWDGVSSVYIDAPASLHGQTKGLCGTFTMNQKDDFVTPEDDVEQSVIAFANKWKTDEKCSNEADTESAQPCVVNPHRKESANKFCSRIRGPLFERCHWIVDPEPFYHNCMYDMCSCEQKVSQCLCPIVAAYAKECIRKGVHIDWRGSIRECGIHCPSTQQYQICGNKCTRSCQSISLLHSCAKECVEGCNCPEGQTLSDETGECIPISKCPCQYNGLEYLPGQKEVRMLNKRHELCTCSNAVWNCRAATSEEIKLYPESGSLKYNCSAVNNEEYVACVHPSPTSCKTMHQPQETSPAVCRGGCACKKGYVLDHDSKKCILPKECPCHHGGKSYSEGGSIQEDCNICVCKGGKWTCSSHVCPGVCSAWGDSHYKTFDSRIFAFHGVCDYLLAKGVITNEESFDISIQNVECGSSGVSCSKSVTLKVGAGSNQEVITFTKDKPIPVITGLSRIQVRIAGLFVFAEVTDLGLVLQWDQNTRVYVKIDPKWKRKIKGLCGNYNDDSEDDFQTPSGGLTEVSSTLFGDSWRLQPYCPESAEITDTCAQHPNRKLWAMQKCGVLKSPLFQPCHSEVPVEPYLERCVFDSCACDLGGDCECLCTALAAYAHECNAQGVPIRWRSQNLCPMQCDEKCSSYSPCISTCPKTTCENQYIIKRLTHLCVEDTCVEGCELKQCPPGQVYFNRTALECVPAAECQTVCLEENGVTYYESDLMEQDPCHTCYCSRHQKICRGTPCPTPSPPSSDKQVTCESGWTSWINSHHRDKSKNEKVEREPMPSETDLISLTGAHCNISQVDFVECRIVDTHVGHKESGLNVSCNTDEGLVCYGDECPDFEIRLSCKCGEKCDVEKPNSPHEKNCHLFYHCVDTLKGPIKEEKSCGAHMMYNRDSQVCDFPNNVIKKWPQCLGTTEPPQNITTTTSPSTTVITFRPLVSTTTVSTTTKIAIDETPQVCDPGDVWKSCGIPCNRVCKFYEFTLTAKGFCKSPHDCIQGCFSEELSGGCPAGFVWRDQNKCVSVADCMCYSNTGEPVKPGEIRYESECKVCQCVNNEYRCDTSRCVTTEKTTVTTPTVPTTTTLLPATIIVPISTTPPLPCAEDNFVPLVQGRNPLPDSAFSASSSDSSIEHQPYFARIRRRTSSDNAWMSRAKNGEQYLQINIGRIEPIFGVSVQGGPNGLVTSYKVSYSTDGNFYHYVTNRDGSPAIFRGPVDHIKPLHQVFPVPIEAQYIRFNPQTWKDGISMRVEVYGCGETVMTTEAPQEYSTEPTPVFTTPPTECIDEMGLSNGMMSDQQILVSSVKENNLKRFGPSQLRFNSPVEKNLVNGAAWVPASNDKDQWIQFDFLQPRNITGFLTGGSRNIGSWVEAFKVYYSQDGEFWNEFFDNDRNEKIFPGNYDDSSTHRNYLGRMLRTRFLRLVPMKWHNNIAVKAEVIGCFEHYPPATTVTSPPPPTTQISGCRVCAGVPPEQMLGDACRGCSSDLFWDGNQCVNGTHCPCFIDNIRYEIGKIYETQDCHECICKLNGVSECKKKLCSNTCELGLRRVLTPGCGCTCKPCPAGTVLCPTSNICINETYWCNGIEDCPDDEINCKPISTTRTIPLSCPPISCPPGTKPVKISSIGGTKSFNGAAKGIKGVRRPFDIKVKTGPTEKVCEPVECVPIIPPTTKPPEECAKPTCAPSHILVRVPTKIQGRCPLYKCVRRHAMCNVTHNTVDTFDGIEFKHDICNHILARDSDEMKWEISMVKNCTSRKTCSRYVSIIQGKYTINLYPDMSVDLDGVLYSASETKHLGGKYKPYALYHIGDSLLFQSNHYGFWVIWDNNENAKIGVTGKLYEGVEGLCGTFNGSPEDDRTTPEGNIAKSNVEFGNSWAIPGASECEVITCPIELQKQAQEICNAVRTSSLNQCESVVDLERFVSRCMEATCACLTKIKASSTKGLKDSQTCRCAALLGLVAECQSADPSIDLSGWRTQHRCPAQCPPSLIYHDCYRHKCEPSCGGSHDMELCDSLPGTCFSGCFCPDGLLRFNDQCISPAECRDCVCDGFGDPQYMSFDRSNFTFNGNCTYIASQDINEHGNHTYQVLVTNKPCHDEPASTCTESVEIHYLNHSILASRGEKLGDEITINTSVDGKSITQFPHRRGSWLRLHHVKNSEITIIILPIQLEVTYVFHNYAFTIRLPSTIFKNKTEGLCGNCNRYKVDDFKTSKGIITNDTNEFGLSWLYPRNGQENCQVTTTDVGCKTLPPKDDPCLLLINSPAFQKCRNVLDPAPYIAACQYDLCHSLNRSDAACRDMEAYVSDCERAGICLDWRSSDLCPFKCPTGKRYLACQNGCSGTCDADHHKVSNCSSVVPDGCYCPEGQVLQGNTCVDEAKCHPCDSEGHFDGDTWQPDKCTNCSCVGKTKQCNKAVCPKVETVCENGMLPVEEKSSGKECCPKITCVPAPPPRVPCSPPKIPKCNDDQNATSIEDANGCPTVVCKCKPCEYEGPEMKEEGFVGEEEKREFEEGQRLELDVSGCCPKLIPVCHPEDCPSPPKCLYPYQSVKKQHTEKKCCPQYECVPPSHSCLIEDKSSGEIIVRKVGSEWRESPCRSCKCEEISGTYESTCNNMVCPAHDVNSNETANYIIDSKPPPGECCPIMKRTACKINDTKLEPGKSFVEYLPDRCITVRCEITEDGSIERKSEIERCNTKCEKGWKYEKVEDKDKKCCGTCKPMGCIHDGKFYPHGKSWKSPDHCTEYSCLLKNNSVQIDAVSVNCETLPAEIMDDYAIEEQYVPGQCCKIPKFTGCKYNGEIYEVGEKWISKDDPCVSFICESLSNGQLIRKEIIEKCSTVCKEGWKYMPALDSRRICCGQCEQVACVMNGTTYTPGTTWQSVDKCTNYSCGKTAHGEYGITVMSEPCPSIKDCPESYYSDGCCQRCKQPPTREHVKECAAKNVTVTEGKILTETHNSHGLCVNTLMENFVECEGRCPSYTKYNQELDRHEEFCKCCKPESLKLIQVPMLCDDGYRYHKGIQVPSWCQCEKCSDLVKSENIKTAKKSLTKG